MAATEASGLTIDCPGCGATLGLKHTLRGRRFQCKRCGGRVHVREDGQVDFMPRTNAAGPAPPDAPPESSDTMEILLWLEDLFIRMILGIFKFILVHVPREVYRAIVRWFPTLARGIKVAMLAMTWLLLVSAPVVWMMFHPHLIDHISWDEALRPGWYAWYLDHARAAIVVAIIYTLLAVAGSAWGIVHIKRRLRRAREARTAGGN